MPLQPPANDNSKALPEGATYRKPVFGRVKNGVFSFVSPEAEEQWVRAAYQAGVSADTWQQGDEIDDETAGIALAGLGGPMPALYLGPDNKYRTINPRTIEAAAVRDHRNKHLTGKTIDQIVAAGRMPGEDEWIEQWRMARAANENYPVSGIPQSLQATTSAAETGDVATRGTEASQASDESLSRDAEDLARIALNSIAGDYGDEGRAALGAIGAWWNGKSFTDSYDEQLAQEQEKSAAAAERQGLKGTAAEMATGFIPIVGDASGLVADFKDWKENGEEWGWGDYGLALAGALPFIPNRKIVKGAEKVGKSLLGKNQDAVNRLGDGATPNDTLTAGRRSSEISEEIKRLLPNQETKFLTKGEALKLPDENRGLVYVLEAEPHMPHAAWYQGETPGTIWSVEHKKPANPSLRYDNPDGDNLIKFDGIEPDQDGLHLTLIDSKTAMAPKPGIAKVKDTLKRIGTAVDQNNTNSNVKYKVYYDFPTEREATRARKILVDLGYEDTITIRVRPATALGQKLFRKLRER